MPLLDPEERVKEFGEVALGYDEKKALTEAERCLNCKDPLCMQGCPVDVDIPEFIAKITEGDYDQAAQILKQKNNLPAICGRVCPQEGQCEKHCVLAKKGEPVAIGSLERFVGDYRLEHGKEPERTRELKGQQVAIVGSGPAGLTCAADLARMGYRVTIFEAFHKPGGVLMYGIPEFRLPKKIVQDEIEYVKSLGVEIRLNTVVGKTVTVDELLDEHGHGAVFISTGAGLPYFLDIPGENLKGVYSANEFLTRVNLMKAYKFPEHATPLFVGNTVAVVGGGNVAMDSARTARRMGAQKVYLVYRRSKEEMPARKEEIERAEEEGVDFRLLTNPVAIHGTDEDWVKGVELVQMELGAPDESGRSRPQPVEGSNFTLDIDTMVIAIGQGPNPLIPRSTEDLKVTKRGNIVVENDKGETDKEAVFAGGDVVTGAATVIEAMGAGKQAAQSIDEFLTSKH
ncbi:MAG: NADPH-dependent glutamate synthase [Clostridiales bacterium]|nr:NADPH-dependent glutamate synthase [Clostridiales bacterium]MCF8022374.1 NADPH-dependent glutamate synthase [Clostridiales bacterium]